MFPDNYFASNYFAPRYFPRPTVIIIVVEPGVDEPIGGYGGNMGMEDIFEAHRREDNDFIEIIMIIVASGILEE